MVCGIEFGGAKYWQWSRFWRRQVLAMESILAAPSIGNGVDFGGAKYWQHR
jgi:hypothetical protein